MENTRVYYPLEGDIPNQYTMKILRQVSVYKQHQAEIKNQASITL